jgi:hypothetical protein
MVTSAFRAATSVTCKEPRADILRRLLVNARALGGTVVMHIWIGKHLHRGYNAVQNHFVFPERKRPDWHSSSRDSQQGLTEWGTNVSEDHEL